MHSPFSTWGWQKLRIRCWAAVLLCAAGVASCSRDKSGTRSAPGDAEAGAIAGRAAGGTNNSVGLPGAGGGGAGAVSNSGGTTGTAGFTGAAGMTDLGGASTTTGTRATGGAGGALASFRDGGIGGSATGGVPDSSSAGSLGSTAGGTRGTGGAAVGGSTGADSRADGGVDSALDTPVRGDGQAADMPAGADFYNGLAGIWLVGWRDGEARHYSWVRMTGVNYGTTEYLSGASLPSNTPYWACDGKSNWFSTEGPYSIMLRFPSSCTGTLDAFFTFRAPPATAMPPAGAQKGMVAPSVSSTRPMTEWWKFPDDQCDATMSMCKNPF